MILGWTYFNLLWTLFVAVYSVLWRVGVNDKNRQMEDREAALDDYGSKLAGWGTLQKVRGNALAKFWRRCERLAEADINMRERLELLRLELEELERDK